MSNTELDSWDGLLKNYLKASNLDEGSDTFVCVGVGIEGNSMELNLEREKEKFIFSLNVTNMVFLKNNGMTTPKTVIGKKITLRKVRVFNPTLKQEVDGLRIESIS